MSGIGICIVVNDNFDEVRYCIGNLIKKSIHGNIRFYILDNGTSDRNIYNYCEYACELFALTKFNDVTQKVERTDKKYLFREEQGINIYSAYNKLFKEVDEDYICVFPVGIFVNDNWHNDLFCAAETICSAGIVGINTDFKNKYLTSLLDVNDKMSVIWKNNDSQVSGVFLMKKEIVYKIGGYNTKLNDSGYSQEELCYRFAANGLNNFYVFGQNSIRIKDEDYCKSDGGIFQYKQAIMEMENTKIFKTQLT